MGKTVCFAVGVLTGIVDLTISATIIYNAKGKLGKKGTMVLERISR